MNGHGHNYHLEVSITGEIDPRTGMIADLSDFQKALNQYVLDPMDHTFLNKGYLLIFLKLCQPPKISLYIFKKFSLNLSAKLVQNCIASNLLKARITPVKFTENINFLILTRDVPVIFLSAASETEDKLQGFEAGGVDYLTKPYHRDELLARVRTHLELQQLRHHLEVLVEARTAELRDAELELVHIAHYDALTGLPNRVLLVDRMRQGMSQVSRRGQRLAVAYLDLDGFKAINDLHGHKAGDQLLMTLAVRMKQALREGDTLARMGGDEFVVVMLDIADIASSQLLLDRLLNAAAEPVQVCDLVLKVSASIGVTFYPQTAEVDADQLLRQADQAMYQAKLAGKNRCQIFDADQDSNIRSGLGEWLVSFALYRSKQSIS